MKLYNEEKYYRMMRNKQLVYTYQLKRLSKSSKRANFIIIYYSVALIVYTLSIKYFPNFLSKDIMEFACVILSIIVLIYSIINDNSRYSERIHTVELALRNIKRLKRRLGGLARLPDADQAPEFDTIKEEFENLVGQVEYRDDLDFYHTIHYLCRRCGIDIKTGKDIDNSSKLESMNLSEKEITYLKDEVRGYILEINTKDQMRYLSYHRFLHISLYALPVGLYLFCIMFHHLWPLITKLIL